MPLYRDEGVVLRTYRLGEADRIVVLMTAGRGKVRAVAKGVRRTKSRFGGRLEPPTRLSLQLHEGRELDVVTQAETVDHYRAIRDDLGRMSIALAMLEVVDQVAREGARDTPLYRMLVGALTAIAERPAPLLLAGFLWKVLALEGGAPAMDRCISCNTSEGLVVLDLSEGGMECSACRRTGIPVSPAAQRILVAVAAGEMHTVLDETSGPLCHEVTTVASRALEWHIDRRLKVLRFVDARPISDAWSASDTRRSSDAWSPSDAPPPVDAPGAARAAH